jgi:hypothetical protein
MVVGHTGERALILPCLGRTEADIQATGKQFLTVESIRQSDGTFDGKNIVVWATPLDPDRPGRKTVARAP